MDMPIPRDNRVEGKEMEKKNKIQGLTNKN